PRSKKPINPANTAKWGPTRVLLADRIAWLCTDRLASEFVTHHGIHVEGVRIDRKFDLEDAKVSFPLHFERCKFTESVIFAYAEIAALYMPGTHTGPIRGDTLNVGGSLFLHNGFKAEGEVRLPGASVGGDLDCSGAQFINKRAIALAADRLHVGGSVFLRGGFRAEGEVSLPGAKVCGDFRCTNGKFLNKGRTALSADGLRVEGSVFLNDGFKAEGRVRLYGVVIDGSLNCGNAHFVNNGGEAFVGDGLDVKGSVFLNRGFRAEGEVRLFCATIGVNLDCIKGKFISDGQGALVADGVSVKGSVFLCDRDLGVSSQDDGFRVEGQVRLRGARIGGDLDCRRGTFINRGRIGLFANGLRIQGDAFLCDELKAECKISLLSARIGGLLHYHGLDSAKHVWLDLRYANIHTLRDEEESWPESGRLFLHGLLYDEIHNNAPRSANSRIDWIRRQGDIWQEDNFWAQPYEQLAKVLRGSGDRAGARDVLVAKNKDKARLTKLIFAEKCWYRFFGSFIGYGHKPWLALPLALVIILFGSMFFKEGYWHGLMTPMSESAYVEDNAGARRISEVYPVFNSFVYSMDVFVPVVDLHQAKYWLPNANRGSELVPTRSAALCTGGLLLLWLWIETALGWILTTLFLIGLTGLVRT
ncbi:MAG: hypothetical protein ACYS0H_24900, partial [Planctomycetota bacterium]